MSQRYYPPLIEYHVDGRYVSGAVLARKEGMEYQGRMDYMHNDFDVLLSILQVAMFLAIHLYGVCFKHCKG